MAKENCFIFSPVHKLGEITSLQIRVILISLLEEFREGKEKEINIDLYDTCKMGFNSPVLAAEESE